MSLEKFTYVAILSELPFLNIKIQQTKVKRQCWQQMLVFLINKNNHREVSDLLCLLENQITNSRKNLQCHQEQIFNVMGKETNSERWVYLLKKATVVGMSVSLQVPHRHRTWSQAPAMSMADVLSSPSCTVTEADGAGPEAANLAIFH